MQTVLHKSPRVLEQFNQVPAPFLHGDVVAGVSENATFDSQPGSQGDVWDAHKDMLQATIGAMLAVNISASVNRAFNRAFNRDFGKELAESLRIKQPNPLVEGPAYLRSD
ncbi:MAG: hypothetical protein ACI9X4_000960 [Glaciecola sp.]